MFVSEINIKTETEPMMKLKELINSRNFCHYSGRKLLSIHIHSKTGHKKQFWPL